MYELIRNEKRGLVPKTCIIEGKQDEILINLKEILDTWAKYFENRLDCVR